MNTKNPNTHSVIKKLLEYINAGEEKIYFGSLSDYSDEITLKDQIIVAARELKINLDDSRKI